VLHVPAGKHKSVSWFDEEILLNVVHIHCDLTYSIKHKNVRSLILYDFTKNVFISFAKMAVPTAGALTGLNVVALAIHLTNGILGVILASKSNPHVVATAPLVEFGSGNSTSLFRPIPKVIFTTGTFTGLNLFAFITAGFHVVYILVLNSPSFNYLTRAWLIDSPSLNPLRWVEYAITATIISLWAHLVIGNDSFYVFLLLIGSGVALQATGLILEKLDNTQKKDRNIASILWNAASLTNIMPVVILLYQLFASKTHNIGIIAYNIFPYTIWFQTFGIVSWLGFMKYRQFANIYFQEKWWLILSLSTKVTLFWLGFATYREIGVNQGWTAPTPGVNWRTVRFTASYLPLSIVVVVALRDAWSWRAAHSDKPHVRMERVPRSFRAHAYVRVEL